ncbi:hypothetical protein COV11_01740 [Candidatus Woesearchaeota archaeon CG10_big_fil_rev_8_21_14_0_10_30_7]|nr:MAG: hypothetical protein COV11_01740 [Candidatus Woesearchaeota archaeon CG10_big_fil_rev_8_21_14_0_10_30_7]
MKIIFGIAGEGYGHATRSKPVIEHLKKHDVKIFTGGKGESYLSNYPIKRVTSFRLVYKNNSVNTLRSALLNFVKIPGAIYSLAKTIVFFYNFKPDLVINDFELFTNWAANIFRVPLIHINNGEVFRCGEIETPKKPYLSYLKALFWSLVINPKKDHGLIPSFFHVPVKPGNKLVFPPLRKEIKNLRSHEGDHILVYQTSKNNNKLLEILRQINKKVIVYGFNKKQIQQYKIFKNIILKNFNENDFFEDLANCKAVITNGGFSLMSESIYLKKPILSCYVRKQFEQEVNSYYLEKNGFGMSVKELSKEKIDRFLENLTKYKEELRKHKWHDNFFEELGKLLEQIKM